VCTLKKAVITEIVRRTLKKLEKQILRMTKYYYYYAKIAFFYNKVRVFFSVSLMKSLKKSVRKAVKEKTTTSKKPYSKLLPS